MHNMSTYWHKYRQHYLDIARLSGPIMVAQLGTIVTAYADTIMVGHYNTPSLAAASLVTNLFNLVILLSLGFSYGITPLVGALLATRDEGKIGAMLRGIVVVNTLLGTLLLLAMALLYFFLDHLGQPAELMPLVRPYYLIVLVSMMPVFLTQVCRQFCDALGHTSLSMWIFTAGNALNIVGNYMLIYGHWGAPQMGLMGAGVSTLVARLLMCIAYLAIIATGAHYKGFLQGFKVAHCSMGQLRHIAFTSLPISLQMGLECGIFTFALVVVGWFGATSLAAYQVILTLSNLGFMIYYAFGAGTAIKIAHYRGEGNVTAIARAAHAGYALTLACAIIASLVFLTAGNLIMSIFTTDEAVIALALSLIGPLVLYQLGDATQILYANSLRGMGDTLAVMLCATIAYLAVGVPLIYLLAVPAGLQLTGIYYAFFVALLLAGIMLRHRFTRLLHHMPMSSRIFKTINQQITRI